MNIKKGLSILPADFIIPLYDMIAVAVILIVGFHCARKGFARGVLDFLAYVLSLIGAYLFSKAGAVFIYEVMIKKSMLSVAEKALNTAGVDKLEQALSALPSFLNRLSEFAGTTLDTQQLTELSVSAVAQSIESTVLAPAVMLFIRIILLLISFSVLFFFAKRLAKVLARLFDLPLIGTVNHIAGFVLGIVEAFVILYIVITLLKLVAALSGGFPPYLTREVLDSTLAARLMGVVGEIFTSLVLKNGW